MGRSWDEVSGNDTEQDKTAPTTDHTLCPCTLHCISTVRRAGSRVVCSQLPWKYVSIEADVPESRHPTGSKRKHTGLKTSLEERLGQLPGSPPYLETEENNPSQTTPGVLWRPSELTPGEMHGSLFHNSRTKNVWCLREMAKGSGKARTAQEECWAPPLVFGQWRNTRMVCLGPACWLQTWKEQRWPTTGSSRCPRQELQPALCAFYSPSCYYHLFLFMLLPKYHH